MANTDFGILLKTLLDKSGINSELEQVQKIVNKYSVAIMPELKTASLRNQMKAISQEIANDFNKAFGTNLTGNDVFKAFENQAKQVEKAVKEEAKAIETARKEQESLTNAMAKGREQAELSRQAEQKRQQMAQNNAINKALEQEYQERQKNIEAARKQAELDKQNALAFTKSASERLSSAISKYSYGDTSDANAMMKQMNRGLSNFGDLSNVQGNITQLSSTVDKIIADLKLSHEQSLQALNEEIKVEQTLQSQKDTFNKKNINAIDYEIQKREEEAKAFSSMLQAQMQEQQKMQSEANRIQLSMSGEGKNSYSLELARITEQYKRLGLEGDKLTKANENVKALKNAHNELADAIAKDVSEYGSLEAKNKAIISAEENRIAVLNRVTNEYKEMALTAPKVLTDIQRLNKAESMQKWADGNSKAIRKYGNDINRIIQRFKELDIQMNSIESDKLVAEFKDIQNVARQNNLLGMTTFDKLKNAWEKFGGWSLATGALTKTLHQVKEGVHFIEELDDALTDVNYTSNVSSKQLEYLGDSAINMAKDLKTSASNVLEAVKIYSTANATAEDILRKAKPAIMLSNISGMSGSESSKTINTALNQFEIEDTEENLLDITDTLQYVSSQLNYDFTEGIKEITEGIEASGNVAKNAGLNLQEYATMVGLAVERTGQSGSTIGNAYKTIFSRITAASATEGTLDEDISKAEASLRAIGVQVRDSENDFRDLSHLMSDIGKVWDNLTDTQKAKVGYDVAGIRQLNVLNSLFGSWESYSDIISNVDKRTGETLKNQEIYAESLKGHLDGLVTVGQSIWNNIIESKILKSGIDLLTGLLTVVDKLTESIGALGTIGVGAGLFAGIKNVGEGKMLPYIVLNSQL